MPKPIMLRNLVAALLLLAPCGGARAVGADLSAAANTAFLSASAAKAGTILRASGLQYRVLRSGYGKRPGAGDIVHIRYSIHLINGVLADSSPPALPASLAMSGVSLAGLAEALRLMHEGDRWQLVLPANLAFGAQGANNGAIPPGQTLVFDVTLVSVSVPAPGEAADQNPFSVWSNGRENGAALTIHP